jgi:hypothetical protein
LFAGLGTLEQKEENKNNQSQLAAMFHVPVFFLAGCVCARYS